MKIAVSATSASLDATVDASFTNCKYFVIVDHETLEFEAVENTNTLASDTSDIVNAQMLADKAVQVVLTDNCSSNAYRALEVASIEIITGIKGKLCDVIEEYKAGRLKAGSQLSAGDYLGAGSVISDMGTPQPSTSPSINKEQELDTFRGQFQIMVEQLSEIQRRIEELGEEEQ